MKFSSRELASLFAIVLGIAAIYFWLAVIEEFGFIAFLGVTVLSWVFNLAIGEINTETEPERRKTYDKVVDAVKSVVGFFAYSTLAAATIMVLYNVGKAGVYLYGKSTDFIGGSVDAYRRF